MAKESKLYEAMYILDAGLSQEQIAAVEERLKAGLLAQGAQVESVHEFGRRRLGYEIKGHTEGVYRVMYFQGNGAAVDELKHEFLLTEEIIRGMVVVANPNYMVGQALAAPAAAPAAETAEAEQAGTWEAPAASGEGEGQQADEGGEQTQQGDTAE